MNPKPPSKQRKSLRDALRDILWRGRRHRPEPVSQTIGSGILRRDPSLHTLPTSKALPFIPEVEERFDIEHDPYSIPDRFDVSSVATAVSLGHSLRPQMSLNSFNGQYSQNYEVPFFDRAPIEKWISQYPRTAVPAFVPPGLMPGTSCHGSVVSFPSLRPSNSTLRIRRSDQSLRHEMLSNNLAPLPSRGLLRKKSSIGGVRQHLAPPRPSLTTNQKSSRSRSTNSSVRFADPPTTPRAPSVSSETSNNILGVKHFSSFCVLDTVTAGCPVTATSSELRYIFDIGEQFCLNNQGCEGTSMDMVTGEDAAGNPITHLVLFSPLVIPSSGRSRFMLASLVDVTDFLHDTASSDLSTISEETIEEELLTPPALPPRALQQIPSMFGSPRLRLELSADSLLSGCSVAEPKTPTMHFDDDIWINIATEERRRRPGSKSSGSRTPTSVTSSIVTVDDVLNDFMGNLQELYSDFFLLAKSPLDDNYFEICNISPTVYASKDYVHGHLSKTPPNDMMQLSSQLILDQPFDMLVSWGPQGHLKQLYCIPLFARVSMTWVCFLVDPSLPPLWP